IQSNDCTMAKLNFYLRDKAKNGLTPIILFISYNGTRLKYPTGKTIYPKYWNDADQLARQVKDFPEAKMINNNLKFIKGTAQKVLEEMEYELKRLPSLQEFKVRLDLELERK